MNDNIGVLYVGDAYLAEQETLDAQGVMTARTAPAGLSESAAKSLAGRAVVIRGPRPADAEVQTLVAQVAESGMSALGFGGFSRLIEDPAGVAEALGDLSPKTVSLPAGSEAADVLGAVGRAGMQFPIFVRSELESAAKYAGVDKCIVRSGSTAEMSEVLAVLRKHVVGFSKLVLKEVWEISPNRNGIPAEYRAVAVGRALACWDSTPAEEVKEALGEAARAAISRLAKRADGDVASFIDFAVTPSGIPFVVESKHLCHGTIRSPGAFAMGLLDFPGKQA